MENLTLNIKPFPKPRLTQSDRWKKRKVFVNYCEWKDLLRLSAPTTIPTSFRITFVVPMPPSWSQKKRREMNGQPHQQRPDLDNYLKAFLDATLDEDGHIWNVHAVKVWGEKGQIKLEAIA